MLHVKTELRPSPIHGVGCFATEPIVEGQLVWTYDDRIDNRLPASELANLPDAMQAYCRIHGYTYMDGSEKLVVLCGDHAANMNHSDKPNTVSIDMDEDRAARDIAEGEELTCDYFTFDMDAADKLGFTR